MRKLISTISGEEFPFESLFEFSEKGESLEVFIPDLKKKRNKEGKFIWERFRDFLPFQFMDEACSLGEGNTPLLRATKLINKFTGLYNLWLKNEAQNPTGSFKDRGSLTTIFMAKEMKEEFTATVSTGNMGHSISAYSSRAGIKVIVFVPEFVPEEKLLSMAIHGSKIFKVRAEDYSIMKNKILDLSTKFNLRIVSGNNPIRVEGYKLEAFEMYEQMEGEVPDFIAVPTSACGHIRGIFKGYRELMESGLIKKLPKMIIVQAKNNSPIVSAIKKGSEHIIPFKNFQTIAEAITSGNPPGGDEIIDKAKKYGWLAEDVEEFEIIESQKILARSGFFVEPSSATVLYAVKKLRGSGKIDPEQKVVLILTGSGLKQIDIFKKHEFSIFESDLLRIEKNLERVLGK
ncbi:MAG: threonine synthase [Candidatus Aminicenantia bacterium]